MKLFSSILALAAVLFLSACSTKEVFEPKDVAGEWDAVQELNASIVDRSGDVALFDDNEVLAKDKRFVIEMEEGYRVIGESAGYVLTTDIDGHLKLYNHKSKQTTTLDLKKTIAAASTDGDVVAVVFAAGDLGLYSLHSKALLLKLDGASSLAVDARIVNPYFMDDLVLFLTLDGKIVIVNKRLKKKLRTVIVSAAEYFNNVIYFDILKERLIVATATKILSFGAKQQRAEYEARNITHDNESLYVATKQGDIISLTPTLNQKAKVHFPFAHFLGLRIVGDKVYALEKEGYLIELSKNLLEYRVYEVDISDESYVYPTKEGFIVDDELVLFKSDADTK